MENKKCKREILMKNKKRIFLQPKTMKNVAILI